MSDLVVSRREWLLAAAAAGALGAEAQVAVAAAANIEVDAELTPEAALAELYAGNERFLTGNWNPRHRDMVRVLEVAAGQRPFAAFLGCADSRVPIEIVFDQGFGDLFVTRIAGNVATSENIASLEFGTLVLGAKVLFVLGHTACGAVSAAMQRQAVPGQISGLFHLIRPAIRSSGGNIDKAVVENVRIQAQSLADASPVIAELFATKRLVLAGGVYDLKTGRVTPVKLDE
jgi:carbonic anhydrase